MVSLPTEPQGKSKNTGVYSILHLQWISLAQELNWGLLHCKQILSQLSYQGSLILNMLLLLLLLSCFIHFRLCATP